MISSEHALLIIDMQQGLFRGPVSPYQADALLANVCLLIEKRDRLRCQSSLPAIPDLTTLRSPRKVH